MERIMTNVNPDGRAVVNLTLPVDCVPDVTPVTV